MSLLIKTGAGLCAGLFAGTLVYAFWPRVEPAVVSARPAVEKPVFVVASPPLRNLPAALTATVAQPAAAPAGDKSSIDKLQAASRLNPGSSPTQTTTIRGIADAMLKGAAPSEEAARFCAQGLIALADGDVAGARAFLERAAEAGDTRALMVLGDTYDSATLTRLGALGIRGDAARAHDYYSRALAAGVGAARQRIAALDAKGN
jgi:hypothetical protein